MDWKDILASTVSAEELAKGAAENAADATAKAEMDKEKGRLGTLRIEFDKKGRRGKPCTIISEFEGEESELIRLKKLLQSKLATGGSHCFNSEPPFDVQILLQGNCVDRAAELLRAEGYRCK